MIALLGLVALAASPGHAEEADAAPARFTMSPWGARAIVADRLGGVVSVYAVEPAGRRSRLPLLWRRICQGGRLLGCGPTRAGLEALVLAPDGAVVVQRWDARGRLLGSSRSAAGSAQVSGVTDALVTVYPDGDADMCTRFNFGDAWHERYYRVTITSVTLRVVRLSTPRNVVCTGTTVGGLPLALFAGQDRSGRWLDRYRSIAVPRRSLDPAGSDFVIDKGDVAQNWGPYFEVSYARRDRHRTGTRSRPRMPLVVRDGHGWWWSVAWLRPGRNRIYHPQRILGYRFFLADAWQRPFYFHSRDLVIAVGRGGVPRAVHPQALGRVLTVPDSRTTPWRIK